MKQNKQIGMAMFRCSVCTGTCTLDTAAIKIRNDFNAALRGHMIRTGW
jgi:hypothetical protein